MSNPQSFPPALEQGFRSFHASGPLSLSNPYSRFRLLLLSAMESSCRRCCISLLPALETQDQRRDAALLARVEAQQQAAISSLITHRAYPFSLLMDHAVLLADLAAHFAQALSPAALRSAIEFVIPEYTDMAYRLANATQLFYNYCVEDQFQGYTEILPGRPLISCHRHPYDDIRKPQNSNDLFADIPLLILLAAEEAFSAALQQAAQQANDSLESALYRELDLICQQHLCHFSSLLSPHTPLETLLLFQYTERYLYNSFQEEEENEQLVHIFSHEAEIERSHLQKAIALLDSATGTQLSLPACPPRLSLHSNKGFIREMLLQIGVTAKREQFVPVGNLPKGADFFRYQKKMCRNEELLPSHQIISALIRKNGQDYRYEIAPHPVELLRCRHQDMTDIGR